MRNNLTLIFSTALVFGLQAQHFSNSPLSSYGIGIASTYEHPQFSGSGSVRAPFGDSTRVNDFNPASYAFLRNGQTLFSTGISTYLTRFEEKGNKQTLQNSGINHFTYAIPFAKRFGGAFGLRPFSKTGYELSQYQGLGTDTIKYTYNGEGSINEVFTGLSYRILDGDKHQLALGFHLSYLFGHSKHQQRSQLSTDISGGVQEFDYRMKSIRYDLGLNYQYLLKHNRSIQLGVVYQPEQNLNASLTSALYTASNVTNENSYQELSYNRVNGAFILPSLFSAGAAWHYRPKVDSSFNRNKVFQLSLMAEYRSYAWSKFKSNFGTDPLLSYADASQIGFGLEFSPHYNYMERSSTVKYLSRIRYRLGVQSSKLPYVLNSEAMSEKALSGGISFPIISQRSVSSLTLGVVAGNREAKSSDYKENFVQFHFGIIIAPGAYDRWFRKYKID